MADRISFMSFLGFPNPFPDSRTMLLFRERMAKTGKDEVVWGGASKTTRCYGFKSQAWNDTGCHISLRRIPENQRNRLTVLPRLAIAEMEPGPKRERKAIWPQASLKKRHRLRPYSRN